MKKLIVLAAASGLALCSAAYAQSTTSQKDNVKANQPSSQMKQEMKKERGVTPGTTGAAPQGTTTTDPRDSNAGATKNPANKSRLEDAKEKP